ncbi:aminotransferase [Rhizobium sp. SSA_523]|uniref:aminotransferase n=1 Tax=Rhizobium sp. SSA_523 TaxID=2952477 RepID=UPI002091B66D|nr:aminotransferase [Rhizobium sp. SSA_523]MCO5733495.1 aminotransferase [Rhizobium sp. SSA_523]WKC23200.1 aminotransferase [Rhizobium sp. SSA_523]
MFDFNPLIQSISPPPVPAVQAWARSYDGSRGPLVDLSQAVPGYPAHPHMLELLSEKAGSAAYAGYGPIEGEAVLRQAYADHVGKLYDASLGPANIHMTAGCNQAFVCAAMAVAGAGDAVLMTEPYYFNHETTLGMLGIRSRFVACEASDGFLPRVEAIDEALLPDVKALALVSPNNPTGAVYPPDHLAAIADLCRSRGIWLILDETYRDFLPVADRAPHGLFCRNGWQDFVISLYSFSKSFCIPGHRLGAITAGPAVIAQVTKIMDNLQICAPRAAQAAVADALPRLAPWREENRLEILRRADCLQATLADLPDWQLASVGAYFAFVRHPYHDRTSAEIARELASQAGISCIPGGYFGPRQELYLRFAFANADVEGIARLRERLQGFSL